MPTVDFEVPKHLKEYGVTRTALLEDFDMVKTVYNGFAITSTLERNDISITMKRHRQAAGDVIMSNGKAASDIIEDLIRHYTSSMSEYYEQQSLKKATVGKDNESSKNKSVVVCKYTDIFGMLWETVKFKGGRYYLVSYNNNKLNLWRNSAADAASDIAATVNENQEQQIDIVVDDKNIKPYTEIGTEPYYFEDIKELQQYIDLAKAQTLGTLFKDVKKWVKKFFDTDTEEYTNLIAADIIFTYFQDRIGKTHYLFPYGEPGTGKGAILECFNQLAYRGVQVTDASAAAIYRLLGNIEKGQVILIIDEANQLENDPFLLDVLKVGYKGNTKVPRVMDAQSSESSKVEYFYAFCFKIIAAEHLPKHWKTGGFLSRCLLIHTSPGNPELDISDIVDNAGDANNAKTMLELLELRRLLFAYRLLHYSEPIPDLGIKGIIGRDRELIKPLIRLFKVHGDSETLDTIKKTLHYFVKERNAEVTDSFAATVYRLLTQLISNNSNQRYEFPFSEIRDYIREQLDGENLDTDGEDGKKTSSMKTDLFGEITNKKLAATLKVLGGKSARDKTHTTRLWKFDAKTLGRFSTVYRQVPDTIELEGEGQQTLDEDEDHDDEEKEE
jgi:hypothetical protein